MAEDKDKAVKRADKRLRKIINRHGLTDAAKEIGEAMQELDDLGGWKLSDVAASVNLPSGDVGLVVFSVVENDELHDLLNQDRPDSDSDADDDEERAIEPESCDRLGAAYWAKRAEEIDLFRDKVSAYYGFSRELIMPGSISDTSDPLRESTFTVLGVEYEVSDAVLTCVGEVQ